MFSLEKSWRSFFARHQCPPTRQHGRTHPGLKGKAALDTRAHMGAGDYFAVFLFLVPFVAENVFIGQPQQARSVLKTRARANEVAPPPISYKSNVAAAALNIRGYPSHVQGCATPSSKVPCRHTLNKQSCVVRGAEYPPRGRRIEEIPYVPCVIALDSRRAPSTYYMFQLLAPLLRV